MTELNKAVFLSYARQDVEAAARICDALRAVGIEVWFDQSELRGGDAWDAAIRRKIKSCALFIPLISSNTRKRAEGYFRLEWKLAVDRSHLMSQDRPFLIPVLIDPTDEGDERVPDKFREVQWSALPDGVMSPAFVALIQNLLQHDSRTPAIPAVPAESISSPLLPESTAGPRRAVSWGRAAAVLLIIGVGAWALRQASIHPSPIIAYSHEDRRMTFAVLPFQSAADDAQAARIAEATSEEMFGLLQSKNDLARVVPRASTEQAAAREPNIKRLAKELAVHFLVRGTVSRSGGGYKVTVVGLDGDSERTLTTHSLPVPSGELTPHWNDEADAVAVEVLTAGMRVEAKRARDKPLDTLDVRDLAFRAIVDWQEKRYGDGKAANVNANELLNRALAMAPDDLLALGATATINLCDCVNAWSPNPDEQKNIGAAAMEKYLRANPDSLFMLAQKARLYQVRLRWEDSLVIAETMLTHELNDGEALGLKATALLRLGRLEEANIVQDALLSRYPNEWTVLSTSADIAYMQADYSRAAQLAQKSTAQMDEEDLRDRSTGPIQLTYIAAEARLGHIDKAKAAFMDFTATLPDVKSIAAIKRWMHPSADLASFEPLYDGLRLAGISN